MYISRRVKLIGADFICPALSSSSEENNHVLEIKMYNIYRGVYSMIFSVVV